MVLHAFEAQIKVLKLIRSGIMGMGSNLDPVRAHKFLEYIKDFNQHQRSYVQIKEKYEAHGLDLKYPSKWPAPLWVKVNDAHIAVAHLHSYGVESQVSLFPLSDLEEVKIRFQEAPCYPTADRIKNNYICVPSHSGAVDKVAMIAEAIKEVQ